MSKPQNDTNTDNKETHLNIIPAAPVKADPATLARERVDAAVDLVEHGPKMIREAYELLSAEVTKYERAYNVLAALDATAGAPAPGTLAGVKAVNKATPQRGRSRRSAGKKSA